MKKFISFLMILVCSIGFSVSVNASENEEIRLDNNINIVNLSNDIKSETLDEISKSIETFVINDKGEKIPVVADVIIEDATPNLFYRSYSTNTKKYKLSVRSSTDKIVSGSSNVNTSKVNATATLTIEWEDNFGTGNVLKEVYGSANVIKGTVKNARAKYGNSWASSIGWKKINMGNPLNFHAYPNAKLSSPSAEYTINFTAGNLHQLYVRVSASIF